MGGEMPTFTTGLRTTVIEREFGSVRRPYQPPRSAP